MRGTQAGQAEQAGQVPTPSNDRKRAEGGGNMGEIYQETAPHDFNVLTK